MAKASQKAVRSTYYQSLDEPRQGLFDELEELFQNRQTELDWYFQVGCCLKNWSEQETGAMTGSQGWLQRLAEALGITEAPLRKMLRFSQQLTTADVKRLTKAEVNWTWVDLSAHVPKKQERISFLIHAAQQGWGTQQVRIELKQQFTSSHPKGGRRPNVPQNPGPRLGLEELVRLSRQWLEYHQKVWAENVAQIAKLKASEQQALGDQLTDACCELEKLEKSASGLRAELERLSETINAKQR